MGRAPCCDKDGLKKGPWLPEEDQKLLDYIQKNGPGNWRTLPKKAGLERCGKSCRLRWTNYLRPDIKRGRFSFEEEEAIIQLHSVLGNKWSAIAAKLPGRTDNEIKNYWNTHIRKRLLRMGIDPVTHTRRLDFFDLPSILNNNNSSASLLQSCSDNNQLNLLKLLSLQSLVNPNLLNLASLLSTTQNHNQNQNLFLQNIQQNDNNNNNPLVNPSQIMQNQFIHNNNNPIQNTFPTSSSTMVAPANTTVYDNTHVIRPSYDQVQQQQHPTYNNPNLLSHNDAHNFAAQNTSLLVNDQLQNSSSTSMLIGSEFAGIQSSGDYQAIMDSLLDTLGLNNSTTTTTNDCCNNNQDQDMKLPSLLSTPSTSHQTPPLSASNSAYQPNSSSNNTTTTSSEEEIDSYCENLMNFDVPIDFFVNNL